jgi:hypothetical protein
MDGGWKQASPSETASLARLSGVLDEVALAMRVNSVSGVNLACIGWPLERSDTATLAGLAFWHYLHDLVVREPGGRAADPKVPLERRSGQPGQWLG